MKISRSRFEGNSGLAAAGLAVVGLLVLGGMACEKHEQDMEKGAEASQKVMDMADYDVSKMLEDADNPDEKLECSKDVCDFTTKRFTPHSKTYVGVTANDFMYQFFRLRTLAIVMLRKGYCLSIDRRGEMPFESPIALFRKMQVWLASEVLNAKQETPILKKDEDVNADLLVRFKHCRDELTAFNDALVFGIFNEGNTKVQLPEKVLNTIKYLPFLKDIKAHGELLILDGPNKVGCTPEWLRDEEYRKASKELYKKAYDAIVSGTGDKKDISKMIEDLDANFSFALTQAPRLADLEKMVSPKPAATTI